MAIDNTLLIELFKIWNLENRQDYHQRLKKAFPKKSPTNFEVIGHGTYGVIRSKDDKEPFAFLKIDYSEPALIVTYL